MRSASRRIQCALGILSALLISMTVAQAEADDLWPPERVFSDDRAEDSDVEFFSPGLHWLVTPDLEIGTRVGWGLTDQSAKFFANTGVGLRF